MYVIFALGHMNCTTTDKVALSQSLTLLCFLLDFPKPTDLNTTHHTSTYIDGPSVSQKCSCLHSSPLGVCDGQDRESGASEQADEGGGRGDPCVFVLECESMLIRQATGPVNMTRALKHGLLHSVKSDLCVYVCVEVCLVRIQLCFF